MQQPPFPFVLVALTGLFAWIAVTGAGWITFAAGFAALVTGAAALYQSRAVREEQEPIDEDDL